MRWALAVVLLTLVVPGVTAGTREDPELRDAAGDETRYPGIPTVDPSVDILAIWFDETADSIIVHLEIAAIEPTGPEVPNVFSRNSYSVNIFIDGEGERTPCSGWGDFGVRWDSGNTADLSYGWRHDEVGGGCPADHVSAEFTVEDNIISWMVPKGLFPELVVGSKLTIARADAWSGDTWPVTPSDDADQLPSRPYVVAADAGVTTLPGTVEEVGAGREAPLPPTLALAALTLAALAVVAVGRRR